MTIRGYLKRAIVWALVIAATLILVVVLLDTFGSQSQPFRYFLH